MGIFDGLKEKLIGIGKTIGKGVRGFFNAAAHVILPTSFLFVGARTVRRLGYGIGDKAGGFVFIGTALTGLVQYIYQRINPKSQSDTFMRRIRRGLSSGFFGLQALSIFALHLSIDILNPAFVIPAGIFSTIFGFSQANNLEIDQLNAIEDAEEYHQELKKKLAETKGFWARLGACCQLGNNQFRRLYQYLKECCKRNLPEKVWKKLELLETYANRTGKHDITALSLFCLFLDWYSLEWSADYYLSMTIMLLLGSGVGVADATTMVRRETYEGHVDDKVRAGVEGYVGAMYFCGLEELTRKGKNHLDFGPVETAVMSLFSSIIGLYAQRDIEFADLKYWEINLYNRIVSACCSSWPRLTLPPEPLEDDAAVPDATRTIEDAVPPTPSTEAPGQKDPEDGRVEGKETDTTPLVSTEGRERENTKEKDQESKGGGFFSHCMRKLGIFRTTRQQENALPRPSSDMELAEMTGDRKCAHRLVGDPV